MGTTDSMRLSRSVCGSPLSNCDGNIDTNLIHLGKVLTFDAINGRLLIPLESYCQAASPPNCAEYPGGWWIASIDGFASLLEIWQSYTPPSGPISFTVPAHPEGMASADWLDTYST
jgi:hypothetical protein